MALEPLQDKIDYLQNREVDDHDFNQDVTISESKQEAHVEATDNDYVEDGVYMVPTNVNKNAGTLQNKQTHHLPRPQHHEYDVPSDDIHKQSNSSTTYTPLLDENRDDVAQYTKPTREQCTHPMHNSPGYNLEPSNLSTEFNRSTGGCYRIIKKLEEGKSGHFWLARTHENCRVVVKEAKTQEIFIQEMHALKRLSDHPNIVRKVTIELDDPKLLSYIIAFEYAVNRNLHGYLKNKREEFCDQDLLKIAIDVANGMKELESCKVVHRDLRAHNILVFEDKTCKVASLNTALCLRQNETHRICQNQPIAIRWQPPEVLKEKKFSVKSDVWAFGVLLFEIFTFSSPPYPDKNKEKVKSDVMSGIKMSQPTDCLKEAYEIMKTCFEFSATKRPSFCQLHEKLQKTKERKYSSETEFEY